jgi:heme A synthase
MDEAKKQAVLSAIRTLLAVAGTWIVSKGWADDAMVQQVLGAIMVLAPLVWGMWDKFTTEEKTKDREVEAFKVGVTVADNVVGPTPPLPKEEIKQVIADSK